MDEQDTSNWSSERQVAYHRNRLEARLREVIQAAEKDYRDKHPAAASLKVKSETFVYAKRPKGFSSYPVDLVRTWLTSKLARRETNAAAVARLNVKHSPYKVAPNILTRPLPSSALGQIRKLLEADGRWINLNRHNSLSKIKLALRAQGDAASAHRSYTVELVFTEDAVIAGDKRYAINKDDRGYKRIRVGTTALNCEGLEALASTNENLSN